MTAAPSRPNDRARSFVWLVIAAATVAVPLTVVPGAKDAFRIPKELEFRALGIVIAAALLAVGWKRLADLRYRHEYLLAGAGVAAVALSTAFSLNRLLSVEALWTVLASALLFAATVSLSRGRSPIWIAIAVAPAAVNALVITLQATGVWTPFPIEGMAETGLIGNRNDAGAYLLAPAIAAVVMSGVSSGRRRIGWSISAVILLIGLLATQTLSAVVAFAVAIGALAIVDRRRFLKPIVIAVVAGGAIATAALLSRGSDRVHFVMSSIRTKASALGSADFDNLTSHRLEAFAAAWEMFMARPLVGVGPGVFPFEYMPRSIAVEKEHPTLISPYATPVNYGEVHNDHLQVLAETGIAGYLVLLSAGVYVASISFRRRAGSVDPSQPELVRVARHLALPLVLAFAVLAVGQFPMELAAPRLAFLFFAAICCGWSEP